MGDAGATATIFSDLIKQFGVVGAFFFAFVWASYKQAIVWGHQLTDEKSRTAKVEEKANYWQRMALSAMHVAEVSTDLASGDRRP